MLSALHTEFDMDTLSNWKPVKVISLNPRCGCTFDADGCHEPYNQNGFKIGKAVRC